MATSRERGSGASNFSEGVGGTGGGVSRHGPMTLTDCTVSGNSAGGGWGESIFGGSGGSGGGVYSTNALTLTNCTVSGNSAGGGSGFSAGGGTGGGVSGSGTLTLSNCTVSDPTPQEAVWARARPGPVAVGVSISSGATLTATSSIFANLYGGNIAGHGQFISHGHNLFSDAPSVTLDPTDLINTDPLLGPLADNGGPTQTMALFCLVARPSTPA